MGNTLIVQAGEHAKELGLLQLTLEDGRITEVARELVPVGADVADSFQAAEIVQKWSTG